MTSRTFKIRTVEGSLFILRFDPWRTEHGIQIGHFHLVGRCQTTGGELQLKGMGALPEPGGRITVSDQPDGTITLDGETLPTYPAETILSIVPLKIEGAS